MTSTYPAIRGKFGSTEYHLVTLKVGDVIRHVINPTEISGWEDLSLEEKYQRELNIKRVTEHIAPYFACDKDRFSGSLILAIQNPDNVKFEQMSKFTEELPVAYDSEDMGFLTISGEEVFIPLDGQHRVEAFKMAINGRSEYPVIKPNIDLAKDMVTGAGKLTGATFPWEMSGAK